MIEAFVEWRAQTRGELTEVGIEVDVDGVLGARRAMTAARSGCAAESTGWNATRAGRLVIVDVKTGKTPVSKDDAQRHAQLAMYQLAVAEGLVLAASGSTSPAAARLVYLGKTGAVGATSASRTR